ncbi:MAG: sensor histidine kinase, partial [Ginsengibacter sp.]
MNPHFIFNSLNSISDYILKNDVQSADIYLTKFAKVMRMILENSDQKEVTLKDDLKALELYMQLESLRMKDKFTYEIKIDESINAENTLIPPLILQPFVENSIWHGMQGKKGEGHILISIKKEGNMINCSVED